MSPSFLTIGSRSVSKRLRDASTTHSRRGSSRRSAALSTAGSASHGKHVGTSEPSTGAPLASKVGHGISSVSSTVSSGRGAPSASKSAPRIAAIVRGDIEKRATPMHTRRRWRATLTRSVPTVSASKEAMHARASSSKRARASGLPRPATFSSWQLKA